MTLEKAGYINSYSGNKLHVELAPNLPYTWQNRNRSTLTLSKKSQKPGILALTNAKCQLFSNTAPGEFNSPDVTTYIDEFIQTTQKSTWGSFRKI